MSAHRLLNRFFTACTIQQDSFRGDTRSEAPISFSTPFCDVLGPVKPGDFIAVVYDESIPDTDLATPRVYQVRAVEETEEGWQRIHADVAPATGDG
jgi:hypothetical protein